MPKKVIAYSCEFGCRRNVLSSRKRMEEHEEICFYNEKTKSCATCRNLEYGDYGSNVCIEDVDIENRLQTNCRPYKPKSK